MPPLILVAAGAIGAVAAARWLYRESLRINAELHPEGDETERRGGRLVRDPETGQYRPES